MGQVRIIIKKKKFKKKKNLHKHSYYHVQNKCHLWAAALTPTSWHIPSSRWGLHGRLLFLEREAGRSARCLGRRCILAWVGERGNNNISQQLKCNLLCIIIAYKIHVSNMVISLPLVGLRAVRSVLLNVHTKEADVCSVNVLEREKGFCPVWERLRHLSTVHKSGDKNIKHLNSMTVK